MDSTANDILCSACAVPASTTPGDMLADKQVASRATLEDKVAAQHEAAMLHKLQECLLKPQPLAVLVAHDHRDKRQQFNFHAHACNDTASKSRALVVTEHCDGAKFCEDLFGHFLLPNGRLAHFYYRVRSSCTFHASGTTEFMLQMQHEFQTTLCKGQGGNP
jgi:hypothetical protein